MKEQQHIFTNKMLRTLLIPVIFEQVLNSLMGTVDTMMVSNVGSAAISAVSVSEASAQWLYGLECLLTGQCGESYFLFASTAGNG